MSAKTRQRYRYLPAFVLLILTEGPAHGGAIHSALQERLAAFQPDTGAIYRTLQKLEEEELVESSWDTSHSGPARRIYEITLKGWEKLEELRGEIEQRVVILQYFLNTYDKIQTEKSQGKKKRDE